MRILLLKKINTVSPLMPCVHSLLNYVKQNNKIRKYNKMDKRAKDKLVRSPRENGGG